VHSVGAWAALAGVIVLGPRLGRFSPNDGKPRTIPGHNLSLVGLGGFILWLGWFGFNAGSTLEANGDIALIALNTHLAAAAGAMGAIITHRVQGERTLMTSVVNGSLAGLVSITAGCASMTPEFAIVTGALGGVIAVLGARLLLRLKVDDVVGAVPVHGFAGVWGTLAAGIFYADNPFDLNQILVQVLGILAAFFWTFGLSYLIYLLVDKTLGLRCDSQHEQRGLDVTEHAELGYPEFSPIKLHKSVAE